MKNNKNLWEINATLEFNAPLGVDSDLYVEIEKGRGSESCFNDIYKTLGIDIINKKKRNEMRVSHSIFCGHRGCGKSTELRKFSKKMEDYFFVIFLDGENRLDKEQMQYSDILLAIVREIFAKLEEDKIEVDDIYLTEINDWFTEKIKKNEKLKDFSTKFKGGGKGGVKIPFLFNVFAELTSGVQFSSKNTEEIREVVTKSFTELAKIFNKLVSAIEEKVAKKLLFIIDGPDHLDEKKSEELFIKNSNKIKSLESNFVYCTPINMIYENAGMFQDYRGFVLPMVKIFENKNDNTRSPQAFKVMRELVYKRVDKSLFKQEKDEVVDALIENSGGVSRDLLRLLRYAILECDMEKINAEDAEKAAERLAQDYRNIIDNKKLQTIIAVEKEEPKTESITPEVRELLFQLLLLRYNNHWLTSHPVIRRLPAYKNMKG